MIPKIIHYCWLSDDPYPEKIQYCIDSWRRILPDYEIRLWNRNRFDIDTIAWVKEAFEKKKYAFAADYIRCYALYTEGGIYLDSDVEVLKTFDDLLHLPYFFGKERVSNCIEAATMGSEKGLPLFGYVLDYYQQQHFVGNEHLDDITMPKVMQRVMEEKYVLKEIDDINAFDCSTPNLLCILPADYFSPKQDEQLYLTKNTYSIHHYAGSWRPTIYNMIRKLVIRMFGSQAKQWIGKEIRKVWK